MVINGAFINYDKTVYIIDYKREMLYNISRCKCLYYRGEKNEERRFSQISGRTEKI